MVDRAREVADVVAMSIFVNPLQFGPSEDLDRYPRNLERDMELAAARGVDLLFAPTAAEMYPHGAPRVQVVPLEGADHLCGASRPGHFQGVLTVVAKLFGIFTPDVAVFGQKDYQQATLIRRMVQDLDMQVEIEVAPTVREADGLAMSSRNTYLCPVERDAARALSHALAQVQAAFGRGEAGADRLREVASAEVERGGATLEYVEIVDPDSLVPLREARVGTVVVVAAKVGATRLIDNAILRTSHETDAR
jgi:pantoate--beta-alanine ligase